MQSLLQSHKIRATGAKTKYLVLIFLTTALLSCFQLKQRQENFSISCADFNQNTISAIGSVDRLLIGGIDSSYISLDKETKSQLINTVNQQWVMAGYTHTQLAYQSWAELGMKSYNRFMRSFNSQQPLSPALIEHYLQFNRSASLLLYMNIETKHNSLKESALQYSNYQTVSIRYKLWTLDNGEPMLDTRVYGYSFKSNEKHLSNQDSYGENLAEDIVYFIAYEGVPELDSISEFVEKSTQQFVDLVNKLKVAVKNENTKMLSELRTECN